MLEEELLARAAAAFDAAWYALNYPDVALAGAIPLDHYLTYGWKEGRSPNRFFESTWYMQSYLPAGNEELCPLLHFLREGHAQGCQPSPLIDCAYVAKRHGIATHEVLAKLITKESKIDDLSAWFSRRGYVTLNKDVERLDEPAVHFLWFGLNEARLPHADYIVTAEDGPPSTHQRGAVTSFVWQGRRFVVRRRPLSQGMLDQVTKLGELETEIFAVGHLSLPRLPWVFSDDVAARENLVHDEILRKVDRHPEVIVVMPAIRMGGAEKYAAELVFALRETLGLDVLVLVTDDPSDDASALELEGLRPLRFAPRLPVGRALSKAYRPTTILALLLTSLSPRYVFCINSVTMLATLKQHGRMLAQGSTFFVSFFSEPKYAQGAPWSTRYFRDMLPFARIISDNERLLSALSGRTGGLFGESFALLPPSIRLTADASFERSLSIRRHQASVPQRLLWVSRWEQGKAVDVLIEVARLLPRLQIDAYGSDPIDGLPPNIRLRGVSLEPTRLPLESYSGFLFTSRAEGMPNIVLEMAGHGIACVCSDVGGLRETFDDRSVSFVDMDGPTIELAKRFAQAISALLELSGPALESRLRAARLAVQRRHSRTEFAHRIRDLLDAGIHNASIAGASTHE